MSAPASSTIGQAIQLAFDGRQATLTVDRPPLNILDLAALAELAAAVDVLASRDDLQLVVIRGAGQRAFSAGVSIHDHTVDKVATMLERFHHALAGLYRLDVPTVAAVRGHCLGGGMELAAVCDLVIASEDSRFGQPEIDVGCFPPAAAALYPELLGRGPAADLLFTGRTLDAAEAARLGFVHRLVATADFDAKVDQLTAQISAKSAVVLRLTKRALRAGRPDTFTEALAASERIYLEELTKTDDLVEGAEAFIAKRQAIWRHR